jgi:hypothetical protein
MLRELIESFLNVRHQVIRDIPRGWVFVHEVSGSQVDAPSARPMKHGNVRRLEALAISDLGPLPLRVPRLWERKAIGHASS